VTKGRLNLRYADGGTGMAPANSLDPEKPAPGYYRHKLHSDGHAVGVEIRFGPPLDPETGEELDRSPRAQAFVNGTYTEMDEVWPRCGRHPITKDEHDHLVALQQWGLENAPDSPQANPRKPVDLLSAPLPF
jgi:hypothetical protein